MDSMNFRKLRLSKLAIYMEQFDENTFFEQLETMMPRKLEVLVLFGNYFALKKSKKYSQWRRFEVHPQQRESLRNVRTMYMPHRFSSGR